MPDIVVWLESTLDIAYWAKLKMTAICENQEINKLLTEWKQFRDFGNNHVGFVYMRPCDRDIILDSLYTKDGGHQTNTMAVREHMAGHKLCVTFH